VLASNDFNFRLSKFVDAAQQVMNKHYEDVGYVVKPAVLTTQDGKRYVKVIRYDSVHCFVDKINGDVLKAASWRAPAKHARGNIFDEDLGASAMTQWGAKYLRN